MNKYRGIALLILSLILPVLFTSTSHAVDILPPGCETQTTICKDNQANSQESDNPIFGPHGIMTKAAVIVALIIAVMASIVSLASIIIIGTAGDDPPRRATGQRMLAYSLAALALAGLVRIIELFILHRL